MMMSGNDDDDVEEDEDDSEDADVGTEDRSQDRNTQFARGNSNAANKDEDNRFARAWAIEMHMVMWPRQSYPEIFT